MANQDHLHQDTLILPIKEHNQLLSSGLACRVSSLAQSSRKSSTLSVSTTSPHLLVDDSSMICILSLMMVFYKRPNDSESSRRQSQHLVQMFPDFLRFR